MQTPHRIWALFGACAVTAAAAWPLTAAACSTCKCGDPTITLLGDEKPYAGRLRAGVEVLRRAESAGEPGVDEQTTDETRTTLGVAYSLTPALTLGLQLPFVRKTVTSATLERQSAQGLGDADLLGRWVLYRGGSLSHSQLAGLRFGVRLPTSQQAHDANGDLIDIDAQPDAGATAPNLGGWYAYYRYPFFVSASATYFRFGHGRQEFDPGNAVTASLLGQYALTPALALQLGVDARRSRSNHFSGVEDPDSGGTLALAYAGIAVRAFDDMLFSAGAQAPVANRLHGHQHEDPALRLGLTYDF